MTRLTTLDIQEIPDQLEALDRELTIKADATLFEIAAWTARLHPAELSDKISGLRLALIPVTAGQGIIAGFSRSLLAIARHLGVQAWLTEKPDVAGIAEAVNARADLWLLSDDDCFIAFNTHTRTMVHNSRATGEGFAVLLDRLGGGVGNETCLVLGCGPVGIAGASRLLSMDATVIVCDVERQRAEMAVRYLDTGSGQRIGTAPMETVWPLSRLILDATPSQGWIDADLITPDKVVVSPGVPLGLTPAAKKKLASRCYHDVLPLGVAVMIAAAASGKHWEPVSLIPERSIS